MGESKEPTNTDGPSAYPDHEVTISSFKMSETLITNEQYVEYLNAALAEGLIKVADETVSVGPIESTEKFVFGATGNGKDKIYIQVRDGYKCTTNVQGTSTSENIFNS